MRDTRKGQRTLSTPAISRTAKVKTLRTSETASRPAADETLRVILACLDDMKAEDITTIDLSGKSSIGDYMVVATGRSQRHVASVADNVVDKVEEAGVKRVWMHRGTGTGSVSPAAVSFCRDHGIEAIAGACPFMFLPRTGFVHRTHRFLSRLFGHDPGRRAA